MVRGLGEGDDPGGRVVNDLKPVKQFGGKQDVAVNAAPGFRCH